MRPSCSLCPAPRAPPCGEIRGGLKVVNGWNCGRQIKLICFIYLIFVRPPAALLPRKRPPHADAFHLFYLSYFSAAAGGAGAEKAASGRQRISLILFILFFCGRRRRWCRESDHQRRGARSEIRNVTHVPAPGTQLKIKKRADRLARQSRPRPQRKDKTKAHGRHKRQCCRATHTVLHDPRASPRPSERGAERGPEPKSSKQNKSVARLSSSILAGVRHCGLPV
jgi:hypothetical protein